MSDLQTGSNASPVASFAEQPSQNSQLVVKAESGGTSQLYMEFTDDTPPPPQATTLVQISNMTDSFSASQSTSVIKQERPDPRKEWINSDPRNPYYCKLCDYSMDCMDAFQGHCMGAKHIKRAVEVFNIKLPKKEEEEKKKNPPQFHCQVCLVTCNSDTAWNAHLLGQKHRKVLEKQSAEKAQQKTQERNMMNVIGFRGFARGGGGGGPIRGGMFGVGHSRKPYDKPLYAVQQPSSSGPIGAKDFATYPEPLIGLEYVTEIQVIGQSPRYHCELCDSKFDHNLKFPHLVGSKHRFNVLKEKNPAIAQSIRGDIKKRSELSSKLLEEARQLERQEGRQQVKTRVEKSPFNRINNQAATHQGSFIRPVVQPAARGGSQQWQSQRGGRGSGRGRGKQSAQSPSYNNQQQFFQQQQQQQPLFNRGGRGRGRGRGFTGTNQTRSWGQSYSFSEDTPNMTFPSGSHGIGYEMDQGQGDRMLPVQAFQPRSPPRSHDTGMRSSHMIDMRYDDFYGGTKGASTYSTSNLEHHDPRLKQSVDQQQKTSQQASATGGMGLLQGALADIGKLVSSEEDASMALQVSNALTHALLQFRMQNMPQESSADSFSGGGSGAQMNTDS